MNKGFLVITVIFISVASFLPTWAATAMFVLALLAIIGDWVGNSQSGEKYKFDDGVDR